MRQRFLPLLLLAALGGCASLFGERTRSYSVFFQPYSSELDDGARAAVHDAASFARTCPLPAIAVGGYSAPPAPAKDVDGLSAPLAEVVKQALSSDGVSPGRISTQANGVSDPASKPNLAVRSVDINVGQ